LEGSYWSFASRSEGHHQAWGQRRAGFREGFEDEKVLPDPGFDLFGLVVQFAGFPFLRSPHLQTPHMFLIRQSMARKAANCGSDSTLG